MIIHNIVFKLEELEVFTKRDMFMGAKHIDLPGYYWSHSMYAPQGVGPFPTIYQAMEHYTIVFKQRKQGLYVVRDTPTSVPNVPQGQLIQVDFKAKKRIG